MDYSEYTYSSHKWQDRMSQDMYIIYKLWDVPTMFDNHIQYTCKFDNHVEYTASLTTMKLFFGRQTECFFKYNTNSLIEFGILYFAVSRDDLKISQKFGHTKK